MKAYERTLMRVVVLFFAVTLLMSGSPLPNNAQVTRAEVLIDRNAYVDDAAAFQALQDAVDAGGTVVIAGVFSLADGQSLIVGRYGHDVTIKASRSSGTLVGGTNTIRQTGAVKMTLAGLTINGSRGAYILVEATSGATVHMCRLTGLLRPAAGPAAGVCVRNLTGAEAADLLIMDNFIDAGNTTWNFTAVNTGILVQGVQMDLNATIAANRIEAAQTAGIFVNDSSGSYTIQKNEIIVTGDPAKGPYLWAVGVWGRSGLRSLRSFVVADNEIEATNSLAAVGYGNFLPDVPNPSTVLVHHNQVHMINGQFSTFFLHGNVDGSVWKHNTVIGSTVNVIAMRADGRGPAEGNLFDQNDIDVILTAGSPHPFMGLVPTSHLYFGIGADHNFAKGFGTLVVVDLGEGNIVR